MTDFHRNLLASAAYKRLLERLVLQGEESLSDEELIDLALHLLSADSATRFTCRAYKLTSLFKSVNALLSAEYETLQEDAGLNRRLIVGMKVIKELGIRAARERTSCAPLLSSWESLRDYLNVELGQCMHEQFRVLLLDRSNRLIKDALVHHGDVTHTDACPREIVRRALNAAATGAILVHNHPGGDPVPTHQDIEVTDRIKQVAAPLEIHILDHIIVGRGGSMFSFKSACLL